jgi:hypothetical protein
MAKLGLKSVTIALPCAAPNTLTKTATEIGANFPANF